MKKVFKSSFIVAVIGLICAYFWGEYRFPSTGFKCLFIAFFLAILEITLSFDNAVVNAMKLEKMTEKWQHRFVTWGILIAVFGMRLVFPILVVAFFSHLSILSVTKMALSDVDSYTHYLHIAHPALVSFGGAFLLMIFLSYFFNGEKEVHWLKPIEEPLSKCHIVKYIDVVLCLVAIYFTTYAVPDEQKMNVMTSGVLGLICFLIIESVSSTMEKLMAKRFDVAKEGAKLGFVGFLYLELIDASFSLDGVLGAFAISKDVIIIMIGLAIGAMFVRSLTLYFVEAKTLKQFIYLEHGAHWAIGALAVIMFMSTVKELPEVVTGSIGLFLVGAAFVSSIMYNKKIEKKEE